jgi:hypothetical protein
VAELRLVRSVRRAIYPLVLVASLLTSCVAHDWTCAGASGIVIDASSRRPLAGVSIYRRSDAGLKLVTKSGSDGRFATSPTDKLYVTIPMGDAFYRCELVFRLAGYKEQTLDCSTGIGAGRESIPPTTVRLHKQI